MKRQPIDSSCINSFGYDDRKRIFEVEYIHGDIYDYLQVPPSVHLEFLRAESKGKFVNERIKQFPFKKIS